MKDIEVLVITVQRFTDMMTGEPVAQVTFGTPVAISEDDQRKLPEENRNAAEIFSNMITIVVPFVEAKLYGVGTKWMINTDTDGKIAVTKSRN